MGDSRISRSWCTTVFHDTQFTYVEIYVRVSKGELVEFHDAANAPVLAACTICRSMELLMELDNFCSRETT